MKVKPVPILTTKCKIFCSCTEILLYTLYRTEILCGRRRCSEDRTKNINLDQELRHQESISLPHTINRDKKPPKTHLSKNYITNTFYIRSNSYRNSKIKRIFQNQCGICLINAIPDAIHDLFNSIAPQILLHITFQNLKEH